MFLVSTCPYCKTEKIPFDIKASHFCKIYKNSMNYQTYIYFDSFSVCKNCYQTVTFTLSYLYNGIPNENYIPTLIKELQEILDTRKDITISSEGFSLHDIVTPPLNEPSFQCPEHVPKDVTEKFHEAAKCQANNCIVASGIMLRLCLETTTKDLLETEEEKKEKLYKQIEILFNKGKISQRLQEVATEIRLDGNDAVHDGQIDQNNLHDLFDFTIALLEEIYTQPKKIEISREKRKLRKEEKKPS